eukprot:3849974-Alexandrium_andersonii.AAC.1
MSASLVGSEMCIRDRYTHRSDARPGKRLYRLAGNPPPYPPPRQYRLWTGKKGGGLRRQPATCPRPRLT